jgi:hypothetical protein
MKNPRSESAPAQGLQRPGRLALLAALCIALLGVTAYMTWNAYWNPAHTKTRHKKVSKPRWSELSTLQREMLAPLSGEWDHISPAGKKTWLIIADRIALKSHDEKIRAQKRIQAWAKMTPEQRKIIRANYALAKKKLKPDEKMARWQNYQQLTEEQRQEWTVTQTAGDKTATPSQKQDGARVARSAKTAPEDEADESQAPANTDEQAKQPAAS